MVAVQVLLIISFVTIKGLVEVAACHKTLYKKVFLYDLKNYLSLIKIFKWFGIFIKSCKI